MRGVRPSPLSHPPLVSRISRSLFGALPIMKRRLITASVLAACAFFLPPARVHAQGETGRITGVVTGIETNLPLQGVRITLLGTQNTVTTNPQGRYTINGVTPGLARIRAAAIGYTPVIVDSIPVRAGQMANVDITLKHQTVELEQIVVVGYGSLAKRDVTGSVGSVSTEQIKQEPVTNAIDAIKGRIPGVDIVSTGFKPGDGVRVRVRGTRSLVASNDPLYVLDGVPIAGGIGDLNPTDIESIEVLKDASATAIYGSRGANGVVLVTSRKGISGNTRTSYDTYVGTQQINRKIEVFGPQAYADYEREAYRTTGSYKCPGRTVCGAGDSAMFYSEELTALKNGKFTDWIDLITKNGAQLSHQLAITGGNERTQFAVSGNLLKQTGVLLGQDYDRKSMRVNFESQAKTRFRTGGSALLVRSTQNIGRGDGLYAEAIQDSPLSVPYDSAGNLVFKPTPDSQRDNPLADVANQINQTLRNRVFGSLFATVNLADGLDYRASFGPDMTFERRGLFTGAQTQVKQGVGNDASVYNTKTIDYTLDNIVSYKKTLSAKHRVDATLLYSVEHNRVEDDSSKVSSLPYESAQFYNLGAAATVEAVGSRVSEWSLQSYMARVNYTFNDRYLLTLTNRIDGSSRLAEGRKFAAFPSVALGWRVIDDTQGQTLGPLGSLKLRASYGLTGNTSVDPYQTQGSLTRTAYSYGAASGFGYRPGALANPELQWEKTATFDAGADFGIMDSRITGTLDYYRANTSDLLMNRQLSPSSGYTSILQNIGATRNTGFEAALSMLTLDRWHGIHMTSDFTFSRNKNEIITLAGGKVDDPGNLWFIGRPINGGGNSIFYDYRQVGIWQSADSLEAVKYKQLPGQIRVQDVNGDGLINESDKVILGNSYPTWSGSFNSRVDYRAFDFSFQAITRRGFMVFNDIRTTNSSLAGRYNGFSVNYWTPENPANHDPRPNKSQESPIYSSARGYEDGSFVKIRNITAGANLPARFLGNFGAQSMHLYVTAQDPFLFTNSTVLDPEGRTSAGTPSYRTFLVGANFGF
ncbi:MAG: TonB-dependent outer membrane protein SusC/RagA [Gemmatimonadetes bacterium]|nr:TonB-dependent outer membrane protein SusC/RagA [Gemmatimonadota bacterium]